jgi:hypothetical protein
MVNNSLTTQQFQRLISVFLLGTAALALFDAWDWGGLMLIGGCLLLARRWQGISWKQSPLGVLLVLAGGVIGLHELLSGRVPGFVFPLVLIGAALILMARVSFKSETTS